MELIAVEKEIKTLIINEEIVVSIVEKQVQIIEAMNALVIYSSGERVRISGEIPSGVINGSNATFTTQFDFVPESVEVFCGGIRLTVLSDFNTSGNRTISLYVSPLSGELIRVNYQKL